jgi:hypothetical protein
VALPAAAVTDLKRVWLQILKRKNPGFVFTYDEPERHRSYKNEEGR